LVHVERYPLNGPYGWKADMLADSLPLMTDTHSKIIAAAARVELKPLGFQRQGRLRLWVADRGFWLNVVELTPSRWSKSVTLTNAALGFGLAPSS
jgi:hypothetical protein